MSRFGGLRRIGAVVWSVFALLTPAAPAVTGQPLSGPPGTVVEVTGDVSLIRVSVVRSPRAAGPAPSAIRARWHGSSGETVEMQNTLTVSDADQLSGTVTVPETAVNGPGKIIICVRDVLACVKAETGYLIDFSVVGDLRVTPAVARRGEAVNLSGAGWPAQKVTVSAPVYWSGTTTEIGKVSVDARGRLAGTATIPLRVADGPGGITPCRATFSARSAFVRCLVAPVRVLEPSLDLTPATARPETAIRVTGQGWCCPGTGTVTAGAGPAWGPVTVDAAGALTGQVAVPADAAPGSTQLRVCVVEGSCLTRPFVVDPPPPPSSPPPSSPPPSSPPASPSTTPTGAPTSPGTGTGTGGGGPTHSSTVAGASTAAQDPGTPTGGAPPDTPPRPGSCAVQPGSLSATPASAPAGARVTLHLRPDSSLKSACRLVVTLGGVQAGPPIDLTPGSALDREVVVPAGVRDGTQRLDVVDLSRGAVLASMPFDVSGGTSLPWLPAGLVVAGTLALLGAGGLAARLLRARGSGGRKPQDLRPLLPPPAVAVWPSLGLPAEIVSGEPTFAQFRLQPASGRIDPTLRVDVQLAADHYTAPAGTRFADVPAASVVAAGMSVPLIPVSVAVPTAVRLVAYVFQQGHLVGWAQATPTVLPAGSVPRQGTAPVSAVPLGTPDGPAPDLTLTISRGLDPRYLVWGFASPHPVPLPTTEVRSDLAAVDARAFAHDEVLSLADTDQSLLALQLRGVARQIGGRIPAPAWAALGAVSACVAAAGRRVTLLVVSEETYVPWELAEVPPGLTLDPQAPGLLGAQTVLGRWVPPDAADGLTPGFPILPPPGRIPVCTIAAVVHEAGGAGAAALPNAVHEGAHLRTRYGAVVVAADVQDVADLLDGRYRHGGQALLPDAVHLAGHGHLDPDHPARTGFVLHAGGQRWAHLTPAMLRGALLLPRTQPFVFFNACESGTPQQALDRFGGLVSATLRAGARGVVAPLWKVGDRIAQQTAQGIYTAALDQGLGVGEALTRVRASATAGRDEIERGCLAYVFFGHPNLRLDLDAAAAQLRPGTGQVLAGR